MLSRCVYCTSAGTQAYVNWAIRPSRIQGFCPYHTRIYVLLFQISAYRATILQCCATSSTATCHRLEAILNKDGLTGGRWDWYPTVTVLHTAVCLGVPLQLLLPHISLHWQKGEAVISTSLRNLKQPIS